jgi:hypothetical protein
MFLSAVRYFKKTIIGSDKGISIILAIIIIIVLGLAGSIFAYLTSSGDITSRSNLTSAAAKYAAKSGVEITLWELEPVNGGTFSTGLPLPGCPSSPVLPPRVSGTLTAIQYLSGNLQGNLKTVAPGANYTPTFCAVEGQLSGGGGGGGNCAYYVITSNGFAGGTEREVTAEVVIKGGGSSSCPVGGGGTGIYVETELPNG